MFGANTEEVILKKMMDVIPSDLDKREGSIIYNAIAPAALEIARLYSNMDMFLECVFANNNMPSEYLDLRSNEFGITRKLATYCIKKAVFYGQDNILIDIPIGSRFTIEGFNFIVNERIGLGTYKIKCESPGTEPNYISGGLIPISYLNGLSKAITTDVIEYGEDIESNESLLNRLHIKVTTPSTSGNIHHYKSWTMEVPGVSDCVVKPLWNGNGTVKVVVIDSNKKSPNKTILDNVTLNIQEKRPIGASVTVIGVTEVPINVNTNLVIESSKTLEEVKANIENNISGYLKSIAFKEHIVRYTRIANCILDCEGVVDYSDLTVNTGISNITLTDEQVGILGSVVATSA